MFHISISNQLRRTFLLLALLWACVGAALAQSVFFTYQGTLTDNGVLANGQYDFRFRLLDQNGAQLGADQTYEDVVVTNGSFGMQLNFGNVFDGNQRWLEVAYRPGASTDTDPFIVYIAQQPVTTAPYALRSAKAGSADSAESALMAGDASKLGGVAADQYVLTTDARLSDAREPLPGSAKYIQNTQNSQAGNFNLSGEGKANVFNAVTQYNIGGNRVLSVAGAANTIVGVDAGKVTTGGWNAFLGAESGKSNTAGFNNSFFGAASGRANTSGTNNAFFGANAGLSTIGSFNSFFGSGAGLQTTTGTNNAYFGKNAGSANTTGNNNTLIGVDANVGSNNLSFATAIGAGAKAYESNIIVLGRINGPDTVSIPGALSVHKNATIWGTLFVHKSGGGSVPLCFNPGDNVLNVGKVLMCSSSIRYKENVQAFKGGLDVINRLRPVTFDWKGGGQRDLGFVAEEVNAVEPLLSVFDKDGQVEGVKYAQISAVLVNAVKEQQEQIKRQQRTIDALKALVCADHPTAPACQK